MKYKLLNREPSGLCRIQALKGFGNVNAGDIGGFVENYNNLSQEGNCWVAGNAEVYGNAKVQDNALVCGYSRIYGNAEVCGNAVVCDDAVVGNDARVFGNAVVTGGASVHGNAKIFGNAVVNGLAEVAGNVVISGCSHISGNARVSSFKDFIVFKNWWSSGRWFTWTRSNNMWRVGCFYGTGAELIEKAYKDSLCSGIEYERIVKYVNSIINK